VLLVGEEDWPFPIRLVRLNNTWRFDGQAARRNLFSAASAATTAVIGIDIEKIWHHDRNSGFPLP
jgi:hypothetical protein